jgi:hypothetical protein
VSETDLTPDLLGKTVHIFSSSFYIPEQSEESDEEYDDEEEGKFRSFESVIVMFHRY